MARAAMRPEVRAQKRKDNRTSNLPLVCSIPKCDNDFYVVKHNNGRLCRPHFENPPQVVQSQRKRDKSLLRKLGLI